MAKRKGILDRSSHITKHDVSFLFTVHRPGQSVAHPASRESENQKHFANNTNNHYIVCVWGGVIFACIYSYNLLRYFSFANRKTNPVPAMTTPEKLFSKVMQTLQYLDSHLPNGSHVILFGLPDGTFLWDNLHNRYHPLGISLKMLLLFNNVTVFIVQIYVVQTI